MKKLIKIKLAITLIFLVSALIFQKTRHPSIINLDITPVTYVFLMFLPILWLFVIPRKTINTFPLLFLVLTIFFSLFNLQIYAENMVLLTYLSLVLIVIKSIINLKKVKKSNREYD